jgi:adenosylcobyric acid synthase
MAKCMPKLFGGNLKGMANRAKALMVLGTASHVGKSVTVAALCRIFRQDGLRVAPFKAQNMALNSFATRDGLEIGRAQAAQAKAARIEPHVDMNPILLKPCSDTASQVVLNGRVHANVTASDFQQLKPRYFRNVVDAYERLAARYDYIILEGAGSPVEINLKQGDIVNMRMARAAEARCILVADIDRGGVFASLVGTYELFEPDERDRLCGFIINKFRGDEALLRPGVSFLEARLKQPCLGVIPFLKGIRMDEEDSVALDERDRTLAGGNDSDLRVCVVRLPHISNFTDFAALTAAPAVALFYAEESSARDRVDVLIVPGSKNTIADLRWLKQKGWDKAISTHHSAGRPVIGICGGFQMLGRRLSDPNAVESDAGAATGLGLLNVATTLTREKVTRQAEGRFFDPSLFGTLAPGPRFEGYEIHAGETTLEPGVDPFLLITRAGDAEPIPDGAVSDDGLVIGTYLHGLFDAPGAASALRRKLRRVCGLPEAIEIPETSREDPYDELAAHFRRYLAMDSIYRAVGATL